ncbi:peptidoglycan D,D-transpeptidase FtsI family protein [Nocardia nova]|uniref:peptidoglycan D,D-transpeptidase FtsI family protein n=1 Tax=Nocardia nova TaxID=37330 RepID=UPI0009DED289|nr:penicillin-binding protein 2 [Nocardia nova]
MTARGGGRSTGGGTGRGRTGARSAPARPRRTARPKSAPEDTAVRLRFGVGRILMLVALTVVALQLLWLQTVSAPKLSAEAAAQRAVPQVDWAQRGSILDRDGRALAFMVATKKLNFRPVAVRKELAEARSKSDKAPEVDKRLEAIAKGLHEKLGKDAPGESDLLAKLRSDDQFVYLAYNVDARVADDIAKDFPEVGMERQDTPVYPGGSLAANVVGATGWDGHGQIGLEASMDSVLAGTDGSHTYDRGSDGAVIPGSERDKVPAVNGSDVELTLDSDLQYYVQQQVQEAKDKSGALDASAVVLDAHTGQVLAMANDNTFNPTQDPQTWGHSDMGNPSVTNAFEPGSVNKIVAATAAIEYGLARPDEVLQVPGSIHMGGVDVADAWVHGVMPYTVTGIFGHSSNVGTLMISQRIGEQRYAEMLDRFGLGKRTDVGLPGETGGWVPPRNQWSGSTFSNLPIGQGLSMSLLQMTGMYQAVANDGVRVPPRIVKSVVGPDGKRQEQPQPDGVRVMSPQTSATLRRMFQAVVQRDPRGIQQGTGPSASVDGYQIAGKTGTAQKTDPACGCYSNDKYYITFAGIAPADDPRYVVGIMLDEPQRASDGSGVPTAAPLFHNIASWALQRDRVPPSPPAPRLELQAESD